MRFSLRFSVALVLTGALVPLASDPPRPEPVRSEHVSAELIPVATGFQPGQTRDLVLRLRMDPGWHTYWQNPGDSGEPVKIEWELPPGFSGGAVRFPTPERIAAPPLMSYGYEGEVLFLTSIRAGEKARPGTHRMRARVRWLECADICLPGRAEFELEIDLAAYDPSAPAPAVDRATEDLFRRAYAAIPRRGDAPVASAVRRGEELLLPLPEAAGWFDSYYFFAREGDILDHAAEQTIERGPAGAQLVLRLDPNANFSSNEVRGVLTRSSPFGPYPAREIVWPLAGTDAAGKAEDSGSGAAAGPTVAGQAFAGAAAGGPGEQPGLLVAILFSFLGGLILNLMPCVFPVLSLKVFSFLRHAGADLKPRILSGVSYTGGILVSFWLLAGTLLILRGTGRALGWGFQLQSPFFVFLLAVALFLFALNLLGVFEINFSLTGLGGEERGGLAGSFFSGILAVVVATPCTAPFMGAALGFALTQSAVVALVVFTALGLGLAFPFIFLTMFPGVARFLPKPGNWMVALKQIMGFLMLATVLWLVWIYGRLTSADGVALVLAGFLLASIGAWILGRWNLPSHSNGTRWSARLGALVLLLLAGFSGTLHDALAAGYGGGLSPSGADPRSDRRGVLPAGEPAAVLERVRAARAEAPGSPLWVAYAPELVAGLRKQGVPMLIDFTADWCLSCKVNERVALSSTRVWTEIEARGLVTIKADWTHEDATITRALADYGRSGVPLYVLYDAQGRASFLPEVLTERIVLDALERLVGTNAE